MRDSIWQSIATTPWWFYVLLYFIVLTCIQAAKPRITSFKKIMVISILFLSMLLSGLFTLVSLNFPNLLIFFSTILCGILIGWLQFHFMKLKIIKNEAKFYIPGSWNLLIIISLVVTIKYYYFGSQISFDLNILKQPQFTLILLVIGGILTGLSIGRLIYLIQRFKYGPYHP